MRNSDIVLITAGMARKEGMDRLDLAKPNAKIVHNYGKQIAKYAPDSIILVVTNPVDVMTTIALESSGFDKKKVIGLGNHLDSLRLKMILAKHFDINSGEIHTRVIGEHGNHMVPLLSSTTIGGIPKIIAIIGLDKVDKNEIKASLSESGTIAPLMTEIPKKSIPNPITMEPTCLITFCFRNKNITAPTNKIKGAYAPKLNAVICAVIVVPILAPIITPIACVNCIKPELTKLITIISVADEL